MPRPRKCRKVCCLPDNDGFVPVRGGEELTPIVLNMDEYEAIRLIDREGFSQEQCGEYMRIARTTVQQIYATTRKKLADALVEGLPLRIERGYASEANDYTTLVSGKVKVDFERGKQSFVLEPGMQVAYNKESGVAMERKVDVAEFVAWKDGKYIFKQKRLEDILSTLSRWYDFEVFYRNEDVKDVLFSGELRRFDDFSYLLRLIERTSDVKFVIDKKVVQVMR